MKTHPKRQPSLVTPSVIKPGRWHVLYAYFAGFCMGITYHCHVVGFEVGFWVFAAMATVGVILSRFEEKSNRQIGQVNKSQVGKN